jgi:hypothetical protein
MAHGVFHVRMLSYRNKIQAVRFVMDVLSCGLAHAKGIVDDVRPACPKINDPGVQRLVAAYQNRNEVNTIRRLARRYEVIVDTVDA